MKKNTALLVLDMQTSVLQMLNDSTSLLNNVAEAIAFARSQHIPVIYSVLGFRPGFPEISGNNMGFMAFKEQLAHVDADELIKIHPEVAPQQDDIIVTKKRVSAFAGNDLEIVLRSLGINHIVLTGFATRGVVLSTAREAADKDFQVTVLSDATADVDEKVHNMVVNDVLTWGAGVIPLKQWI